ncbi:MAG: hypothetical protein PHQ12_04080 [Chthoniobacteraceae bacterium]|nr:hypothetical protein [Chthoniobacteraceae bacterium]
MHVNGHPLKCPHCGGVSFRREQAQLNTAGMTFLKLDWLNKSADTFICADCGRIEWFLDARVTGSSTGEGRDCPHCGYFLSESVAVCPNCGHPA